MNLCACGCSSPIDPKPWHKYRPGLRYIPGHAQKRGGNKGLRWGKKLTRITVGGQVCSCGCGLWVGEFFAKGAPRYSEDGTFYASKGCRGRLPRKRRPHQASRLTSKGYRLLYLPDYPGSQKDGWVPEQRLVWEEANHRALNPNEVVHHINGVRLDNRPENLVALTINAHRSHHARENPLSPEHLSTAGKKGAAARWGNRSK